MRKFLIALAMFGFASTAFANNLEVQISGNPAGGTGGSFVINSEELGDNTYWEFKGEVYYSINDNIQVGSVLGFQNDDSDGFELGYTLGTVFRYNLNPELTNSVWFGAGLNYTEFGVEDVDSTSIEVFIQAGKRFALSDNFTYTPNFTYNTRVSGDDGYDEGYRVSINLISFSGFMNL